MHHISHGFSRRKNRVQAIAERRQDFGKGLHLRRTCIAIEVQHVARGIGFSSQSDLRSSAEAQHCWL